MLVRSVYRQLQYSEGFCCQRFVVALLALYLLLELARKQLGDRVLGHLTIQDVSKHHKELVCVKLVNTLKVTVDLAKGLLEV